MNIHKYFVDENGNCVNDYFYYKEKIYIKKFGKNYYILIIF